MVIKKGVKTIVDVALTGTAMQQVGNNFTGNLRGIGNATQVTLGAGLLSRAAKGLYKKKKKR